MWRAELQPVAKVLETLYLILGLMVCFNMTLCLWSPSSPYLWCQQYKTMLKTWRYNFDWRTGGRWVLYLIEVWLAAIWSKKGRFFIGLSQHFLGCSFQAFGDNLSLKIFVREKQKQKLLGNKECFVCHYLISSYSRCVLVNSQSRVKYAIMQIFIRFPNIVMLSPWK